MINLVLIGPQAVGKTSIGNALQKEYALNYISLSESFRSQLNNKTELGLKAQEFINRGELIDDEIIFKIFKEVVNNTQSTNGLVIDGFPQNIIQVGLMGGFEKNEKIDFDYIINFEVSDEVLVKRISQRSKFHEKEESIRAVLKEERDQINRMLNYYSKTNKLININADQSIDKMLAEIESKLNLQTLQLSIDQGFAPDDLVAEIISDISILYNVLGGTNLEFTLNRITTGENVEV